MFRLSVKAILVSTITVASSHVVTACKWDLQPSVLLITSYPNAEYQAATDALVFHQLQTTYHQNVVRAFFSSQDDNTYGYILQNLITTYQIKAVFILDPSFANYLPSTNQEMTKTSNLMRIMHQFSQTNFYFFNKQIANNFKKTNNIFEFRLDYRNITTSPNKNDGTLIANYFINSLTKKGTVDTIDNSKYQFDVDAQGHNIIKIGVINNIGNDYQQRLLAEFVKSLKSSQQLANVNFQFAHIDVTQPSLVYNSANILVVQQAAYRLYHDQNVNFIFNTNSWYNNAIAFAVKQATMNTKQHKTIRFIGHDLAYAADYNNHSLQYLQFSANQNFQFLQLLNQNSEMLAKYQVIATDPESLNAYGINGAIDFVAAT